MANIDSIIGILESGIRSEVLRQKAIAGNVANMQTPGYRSIDVKFADLLNDAIEKGDDRMLANLSGEVVLANKTEVKPNGNDVSLEAEVGKMIENTVRHAAYTRILKKKYTQMELAINVKGI